MIDTFRLAWRNLGRNLRRTLTTASALAFGISLCVATYGLIDGLSAQLVNALTRLDLGHVQVHNPKFADSRNLQDRIADPAAALSAARAIDGVKGATARGYAYGLVSGKRKSSGVELVGVDPQHEPLVTELGKQLREGRYLETQATPWPAGRALSAAEKATDRALTEAAESRAIDEIEDLDSLDEQPEPAEGDGPAAAKKEQPGEGGRNGPKEARAPPKTGGGDLKATATLARTLSPPPSRPLRVILGSSLTRVLGTKLGGQLYISTLTTDGQAEAVFLEVIGIYETGTQLHDRHRIYLHLADLQRLTHLGKTAHEIAISVGMPDQATAIAKALGPQLPKNLVRPWNVVRPDIQQMITINTVSTDLMVLIIFIVATLGVVNTMLMNVFERTRELGVLKAIGMSGGKIVGLIVSETFLMVLCAALVGTGLGLALDAYMVHYGVDLTSITGGFSLSGIGIKPIIYGVVTLRGVLMPTAVLATSCVLASLYPAIRAARMQPAIGMRET